MTVSVNVPRGTIGEVGPAVGAAGPVVPAVPPNPEGSSGGLPANVVELNGGGG